jgi:enoyl-CoA hydratase
MDYQHIELTQDGLVAVVAMYRPPVNAVNSRMREELIHCFDSFNDRNDVRAVVLTGKGSTFCAGADLKDRPPSGEGSEGAFWHHSRLVRECTNSIRDCHKPVISAVNGAAIGTGFAYMTAADIWVASNTAYVAMTEINVGLAGGTGLLQEVFGKSRARRMFFTGERVTADELFRLGLIEASLPPDELMPYALALARTIASKAPAALLHAKQASQVTLHMPPREGYRYEQNITRELSMTEDSLEARRAFAEKRAPVYRGK